MSNSNEIVNAILAASPGDRVDDDLLSDVERRALAEFTVPRTVGSRRVWLLSELRGER